MPYGQIVEDSGSKYGFTGKEKDVASGMYYFSARYYNSDTGRFTGVDPVAKNHAYSYVNNNPMNYVDPDGRDLKDVSSKYLKKAKDALLKPFREAAYNIISAKGDPSTLSPSEVGMYLTVNDVIRGLFSSKGRDRKGYLFDDQRENPNLLKIFLRLEENNLPLSEYRPLDIDEKYKDQNMYSLKEYIYINEDYDCGVPSYYRELPFFLMKSLLSLKEGEIEYLEIGKNPSSNNRFFQSKVPMGLGHSTISFGRDEQGLYLSLFDVWDFGKSYNKVWDYYDSTGSMSDIWRETQPIVMDFIGESIIIYDRFYLDEDAMKSVVDKVYGNNKKSK